MNIALVKQGLVTNILLVDKFAVLDDPAWASTVAGAAIVNVPTGVAVGVGWEFIPKGNPMFKDPNAPPPPPPPPVAKVICDPTCDCRKGDQYPYAEDWVRGELMFTGTNGASLSVNFTPGKFTDVPLIDSITVNSQTLTSNAYLRFSTGNITKSGFVLWAKADAAISYTIPVVIHAVQRTKEKA